MLFCMLCKALTIARGSRFFLMREWIVSSFSEIILYLALINRAGGHGRILTEVVSTHAPPRTIFSHHAFWLFHKWILVDENTQYFCILVRNFFTPKHYRSTCRSRWGNLDGGQYRFQPIKFINLVVSSPCETEPFSKKWYYTTLNAVTLDCTNGDHALSNIEATR